MNQCFQNKHNNSLTQLPHITVSTTITSVSPVRGTTAKSDTLACGLPTHTFWLVAKALLTYIEGRRFSLPT